MKEFRKNLVNNINVFIKLRFNIFPVPPILSITFVLESLRAYLWKVLGVLERCCFCLVGLGTNFEGVMWVLFCSVLKQKIKMPLWSCKKESLKYHKAGDEKLPGSIFISMLRFVVS